jgi:hypothetical protein
MKKTDYSEICEQKLEYLNYSPKTIKLYRPMINNRFNVVYHLLGFVINLFYLCKKYRIWKMYY